MSGTARKAVSLLFALGALFACVPSKTVLPPVLPDEVTPAYLIGRITYDNVRTLNAMAKIRMERGDDFSTSMRGVINFRRPADLAASLFGPFGVTIMKVLVAEEMVEVLIPKEDTLFASVASIPSLLPDSASILAKDYDISENNDDYMLNIYATEDDVRVLTSRYYFDKQTLFTRKIEKYNSSSILMAVLIEEMGEENVPTVFSVIIGKSKFDVKLDNIRINTELPEAAFAHLEADKILPLEELRRAFNSTR